MSRTLSCKLLVIGGGPAGYVAAIRAGQLGIDTILVETDRPGGTCLLRGCIPSKALIHAGNQFAAIEAAAGKSPLGISIPGKPKLDLAQTVRWKDGIVDKLTTGVSALLKRAKVTVIKGWAVMQDGKSCLVGEDTRITAEHVILATGSEPVPLPGLPFGGAVISSTEALSLDRLPLRLLVIGAGYIGLELGIAFRRLGSAVTVVEATPDILPLYDHQLTDPVKRWLDRANVGVKLSTRATQVRQDKDGAVVTLQGPAGDLQELTADKVLVTVGRRPRVEGWGLENLAVDRDGLFIKVDDRCQTSMKNVWAIGDLVGEPMLAHKGSAQGEMVAEIIAGQRRHFRPVAIPAVCFTEPEIIAVGLLPHQAESQGIETIVSLFPFAASGRALTMQAGDDNGFVRIVARKDDHVVLGVQAVGAHVAELSAAFVQALEMGALLEDIAGIIHVHPTLSEAFPEAAMKGLGHAIHI
jgi:dihydrolipoamide dehydrogenase